MTAEVRFEPTLGVVDPEFKKRASQSGTLAQELPSDARPS